MFSKRTGCVLLGEAGQSHSGRAHYTTARAAAAPCAAAGVRGSQDRKRCPRERCCGLQPGLPVLAARWRCRRADGAGRGSPQGPAATCVPAARPRCPGTGAPRQGCRWETRKRPLPDEAVTRGKVHLGGEVDLPAESLARGGDAEQAEVCKGVLQSVSHSRKLSMNLAWVYFETRESFSLQKQKSTFICSKPLTASEGAAGVKGDKRLKSSATKSSTTETSAGERERVFSHTEVEPVGAFPRREGRTGQGAPFPLAAQQAHLLMNRTLRKGKQFFPPYTYSEKQRRFFVVFSSPSPPPLWDSFICDF